MSLKIKWIILYTGWSILNISQNMGKRKLFKRKLYLKGDKYNSKINFQKNWFLKSFC